MVNENIISMAVEAWGEGHEIFWFDDDGLERFFALAYAAGQRDMQNRVAGAFEHEDYLFEGRHIAKAIRALPIGDQP
jgi:hypothetical protein